MDNNSTPNPIKDGSILPRIEVHNTDARGGGQLNVPQGEASMRSQRSGAGKEKRTLPVLEGVYQTASGKWTRPDASGKWIRDEATGSWRRPNRSQRSERDALIEKWDKREVSGKWARDEASGRWLRPGAPASKQMRAADPDTP